MSAKQKLYQKAEAKNDGFLTGQVGWIIEAMEEHAIEFARWINRDGWQEYDQENNWINQAQSNRLYSTSELYEMFEKSKK